MENTSIFISLFFILITIVTAWQFYRASGNSTKVLLIISVLMVFQTVLGLSGFYQVVGVMPPRFALLLGPGILFVLLLFIIKRGRAFLDSLNIERLTILHTVRIAVEFVLYYVFLSKLIPVYMTFEGYNFDILSGISAPIIYYLVFIAKKAGKNALLIWNFIGLGLLINVLVIAVLSAQTPIQKFAFEQPNVGVTYFPFVWLPGIIVPIVLLSHLTAIRQLLFSKQINL